jgi:hypothetical protein
LIGGLSWAGAPTASTKHEHNAKATAIHLPLLITPPSFIVSFPYSILLGGDITFQCDGSIGVLYLLVNG